MARGAASQTKGKKKVNNNRSQEKQNDQSGLSQANKMTKRRLFDANINDINDNNGKEREKKIQKKRRNEI